MRLVTRGSLVLGMFLLILAAIKLAPAKEELYVSLGLAIAAGVFIAIALITAGISLFSCFRRQKR